MVTPATLHSLKISASAAPNNSSGNFVSLKARVDRLNNAFADDGLDVSKVQGKEGTIDS